MIHRHLGAGLAALLLAGPVSAQGFAGAEISAETLAWSGDGDLGRTTYGGRAAFDLWAGVGIGADLSFHGFGPGEDGRSLTLHASYAWTDDLTFGGFVARDEAGDLSTMAYGAEAATALMGARVEGALGKWDGDPGQGALILADASYPLGGLAVTGFAGAVTGDLEASRIAVGGEYRLGLGPTLYAEVGKLSSGGEAQAYLGLGARIALGRDGVLMRSRGLLEVTQGF